MGSPNAFRMVRAYTPCNAQPRVPSRSSLNSTGPVHWLVILSIVASMLLSAGVAMASGSENAIRAGWIDSFKGSVNGYAVIRAGQELPVRYLMPLEEGDRLEIRTLDGLLRIHLSESEEIELNHLQSGFTVPAPVGSPTTWGNLMQWAGNWFTALHNEPVPARPITAASRGDEDTMPASGLLFSEQVGWPAGERPIALAWRGGRAPFQITLWPRNPTAEPLLKETDIAQRTHRTAAVSLSPGDYVLTITDAAGRARHTQLIVGLEEDLPRPLPGSIPDALPAELKTTLEAAWLASQNGGHPWRLAAYQRLVDLDDYPPATLLRRALLEDTQLPTIPASFMDSYPTSP